MKEIKISHHFKYSIFNIKNRTIYSPNLKLRTCQKIILRYFKKLYPLKISIKKTADIHTHKKYLLKMDIEHFYDSVPISNIEQVLQNFIEKADKPKSIITWIISNFIKSYGKYNLEEIKKITTVNNKLPTGAVTSPYIANACMKKIDEDLSNYCKTKDIRYSRYMDDMFFSADDKNALISTEIYVKNLLAKNNMGINPEKIKYISDNKKQVIMGILVNKEASCLPKETKRKIRSVLHRYMTQKTDNENQVLGYLGYVYNVDKDYFKILNKYYCSYKRKYNTPKDKIKRISKLFDRKLRKLK